MRKRDPYTTWLAALLGLLCLLFLGQFILFRIPAVYNLNLRTSLYDAAWWVKGEPAVLVTGSSHGQHGVVPEIIERENGLAPNEAVNVAISAGTPFETWATLSRHPDILNKARIVYCTIEPWIFSERYFLYKEYEKILLNQAQWDYLAEKEGLENNYWLPINVFLNSLAFRPKKLPMNQGYFPLEPKPLERRDELYLSWVSPRELFNVSGFELTWLARLKKLVEGRGAKFVLVLMPAHAYWRDHYLAHLRDYDVELARLLNERLGPTTVIGTFDPAPYGLADADFFDDNHLSDSGARKVTKQLFGNVKAHLAKPAEPIRPLAAY